MQETQETQVRSPAQEDTPEAVTAIHSSILVLENPMDKGAWRATVHGVAQSQTQLKWLSTHACMKMLGFQIFQEKQEKHIVIWILLFFFFCFVFCFNAGYLIKK